MPNSSTGSSQSAKHTHAAFFRQSGWLMISAIAGGAFSWAVHFLAKHISKSEYGVFGVMIMVITTCSPSMPLQMVFAQQSAHALAVRRERQLAGMIRFTWLWTFLVWAAAAAVVVAFQGKIVESWRLGSPLVLWVTMPVVLASLWTPIFSGLLQGRQDFFWLGWVNIFGGISRFAVAAVAVLVLNAAATGMIAGALVGMLVSAGFAIWQTRDLWAGPRESFDGSALLRQVVPLILGFGACQFLFTADSLFAMGHFTAEQMGPYIAAGTLSRALLWIVMPLATVMFPKLVHSSARLEKTNLFDLVVLGTAVLGICGALGLSVVGPWVVRFVYTGDYVAATSRLLPWYAGAMVPLALANVIANDLLARSRIRVVPFMVVVALAYGFVLPQMLNRFPGRLEIILQTLAVFNGLLLAVCAAFRWGVKGPPVPSVDSVPAD